MPFFEQVMNEGFTLDNHMECSNWTFMGTACSVNGRHNEENGFIPELGALRFLMPDGPTLAGALSEIDAAFEARIRRAMEVGNLPGSSDAGGMAKVATGVLNGMAVRARAGGDLATLRAMGGSVVDMICGRAGR